MSTQKSSFRFLALTLVTALIGGALGGAFVVNLKMINATDKSGKQIIQERTYVEESQVINTVKKVSPSVVSIVITKDLPLMRQRNFNFDQFFFGDPFGSFPMQEFQRDENGDIMREQRKVGGGSGFIISEDGLIVTNRHVVEDTEASYTVILNDGAEYDANVLARDTLNDFAVLKIQTTEDAELPDLPAIELGDSSQLQIGQKVVAIGNALAEYENTVTTGVISAIGRDITAGSAQSSENLINLIQTDAAINPGNSGGPLVNLAGQVVAINTAIASGAQGIGFAIPINDVKRLIDSVQEHGKIVRPYMGVRFIMLNEAKADELQIDVEHGALLVGNEIEGEFAVVPGSPADKAGLQIKDVILSVDGQDVTIDNPLHVIVGKKQPGDKIDMKVWRSGEIIDVTLTLAEND